MTETQIQNKINRIKEFIRNVQSGIEHTEDAIEKTQDLELKEWLQKVINQNLEVINHYQNELTKLNQNERN